MKTPGAADRVGIAGAGNWLVDHIKIVDKLPEHGMLASILSETRGSGGAPFNVLLDLARMRAPFPLSGYGVTGADGGREFITELCRRHGLDIAGLAADPALATSYTDVMTEQATGRRTFYHCRGANACFDVQHVPIDSLTCRIFHLGYLLLLDRMDEVDGEFGTVAARLLAAVRQRGIRTSLDVVSEDSDRFGRLVPPALRYTDYLIINEIEAARIVGRQVRSAQDKLDGPALEAVVEELLELGEMTLVVVHMPEGAYLRGRAGERLVCGSLRLPSGYIKGAVGAGDAFCAGLLYGLHEDWDLRHALRLGTCAAAACLAHPGSTDGLRPLDELLALETRFPPGDPPV